MMRLGAGLIGLALAGAARAAAPGCPVPPNLAVPRLEFPTAAQPPRAAPIAGYTLALTWMPQHCRHTVGGAEALQCGTGRGEGFVLHGLWPDGEGKNWPQWCAAAAILPKRTIAAHYCATPSAQLLQHEWAKHGTCIAGATPDSYFDQSDRLFYSLRFPDMAALAGTSLTEGRFAEAFAGANRGLATEDIRLNLDRLGWLQEVWLCLDTRFQWMRCAIPRQPQRVVRVRL
jgi:ribonuclease T2